MTLHRQHMLFANKIPQTDFLTCTGYRQDTSFFLQPKVTWIGKTSVSVAMVDVHALQTCLWVCWICKRNSGYDNCPPSSIGKVNSFRYLSSTNSQKDCTVKCRIFDFAVVSADGHHKFISRFWFHKDFFLLVETIPNALWLTVLRSTC